MNANPPKNKKRFWQNLCKIVSEVSHSWRDDAVLKWAALEKWCESFRRKNGRAPTLWLDKVCIDQDNIADGPSRDDWNLLEQLRIPREPARLALREAAALLRQNTALLFGPPRTQVPAEAASIGGS